MIDADHIERRYYDDGTVQCLPKEYDLPIRDIQVLDTSFQVCSYLDAGRIATMIFAKGSASYVCYDTLTEQQIGPVLLRITNPGYSCESLLDDLADRPQIIGVFDPDRKSRIKLRPETVIRHPSEHRDLTIAGQIILTDAQMANALAVLAVYPHCPLQLTGFTSGGGIQAIYALVFNPPENL